jgi:phosphoribosylpyrophosphate synthetase
VVGIPTNKTKETTSERQSQGEKQRVRIILGLALKELGERIAGLIGAETIAVATRTSTDGESYIRLDGECKGGEVVIVQTTSPPQDTNLTKLALMANATNPQPLTGIQSNTDMC